MKNWETLISKQLFKLTRPISEMANITPLVYAIVILCVAFKTSVFAIFVEVYMHAHLSLRIKTIPLNNAHARIVYTRVILKQCL